jgi:alanine racemase
MLMHEPSCVEVNLTAIDHNMAAIRRLVGSECKLCPIVKADAYGLGAARVARRLVAAGADLLAVYSLPQAAELAGVVGSGPGPGPGTGLGPGETSRGAPAVLVLMPVADIRPGDETSRMLTSGRLHLTVHDLGQLEVLASLADHYQTRIPIHLEVDSGLSRGGARPEEAGRLLERIAADAQARQRFHLRGVFTHFANSRVDREATDGQLARFDELLSRYAHTLAADTEIHVASTYALFRHRRYHRSMVRFGLAWAGYGLEELDGGEMEIGNDVLRPCVRWRSRVVQVKRIPPGTAVGYGSRWVAKRPSTIGLVPVGYADGFPVFRPSEPDGGGDGESGQQKIAVLREVARGSRTEMVREFAPVIGAVNMDQITVDLTEVDCLTQRDGGVGMTVEIISPDAGAPNHLPRLAGRSGMIPHEMLCRIHPKIPRLYVVDGEMAEEPTAAPVSPAQSAQSVARVAVG